MRIPKPFIALTAFLLSLNAITSLFGEGNRDKILRVASQLEHLDINAIEIKKISGGQTNDNYKVSSNSISCFFRCAAAANSTLGSSLEREFLITHKMSEAGIAPKVILYAPHEGILVTDFIDAISDKVDVRDPKTLQNLCRLIAATHNCPIEFPSQFCPFKNIQDYVLTADDAGIQLPEALRHCLLPKIETIEKNLSNLMTVEKKPAHLDLHAGNVMNDGEKLWLIDWEYAAMGDPFFDLATLASIENFSDDEMHQLLCYYLDREPVSEEIQYIYHMRILADARWALWAYLQAEFSAQDEPFEEIGDKFLETCRMRLDRI